MEKLLHAYILSGPGEETRRAARELAAAALCQGPEPRPCGDCRHCRKVFSGAFPGIHPDVASVERQPDSAGRPRRELTVDQIRALRLDAAVLPNEAAGKVYILPEADALNPSAQNAFLKLLEEPPAGVVFVLCAQNRELLLPTVRSRCAERRISGRDEAPPESAAARARGYLDALGDRAELLRCCAAMEKLDAAALLEVVRAIRSAAPGRGLPLEELLALEAFLARAEEYLRVNLGVKLVTGYLATCENGG